MKAAETSVITVNQGDSIVHMSVADKQSNTGLVFHERLLILCEGQFFGYISKFNTKNEPKNVSLEAVKEKVLIKYIKAIEHDHENLSIKFTHVEKNKQETKKWAFKFASQDTVKKWVLMLKEEKAKRMARSAEKKSRSRERQNQLSLSKGISIAQKPNVSNEAQQPRQTKQTQPQLHHIEDSQNREFVNPLYGYDSVESDVPRKVMNNKRKAPEPINPTVQPSTPHRNMNISPKRENNFIKKQNQVNSPNGRKPGEKSNLEFKISPEKINNQIQKQKSSSNQQNSLFNRKPRESYVDMIQKIVKDSELRNMEKMKQRVSFQQSIDSQGQSRQLYVNDVLEEFIRYDVGETQKWKQQNIRADDGQSPHKRSQVQLKELQELQKMAFNLQKQHRNITLQQLSHKPVNYTDFSKEIAMMLRNKRFERQGHEQISPQKQANYHQIDIKTMPFSYRYLLATSPAISLKQTEEDMMQVLAEWKEHCENLMKQIVMDLVNQGSKFIMKAKKKNIMYFEVDDVQVKIATTFLKTVHFQVKDAKNSPEKPKQKREERISDYSSAKDLETEFKNYCALNDFLEKNELPLQTVNISYENSSLKNPTNHSSRLKTPLTAVVEYYGFVALFKLNPKFSYRQDQINEKYIRQKQLTISQISNIDVKWLEEGAARGKTQNMDEDPASNKTLIMHIDENYYAQLHLQRNQGKNSKYSSKNTPDQKLLEAKRIFDVDVLQEIDSFLLKDYLTKSLSNGILRKQLIEEMKDREEYKNTTFTNPQKVTNPTIKSKLEANLTLFSGEVLQKLSVLILKLDSMSFYYLHPEEVSDFFHKQGVNLRYMGLAFDNLSEVYAKKCLMTEITARISKLLLRKTIQDVLLPNLQANNKTSSPMKSSKLSSRQKNGPIDIILDVIDLLNCILGSSPQSTAIWAVLSKHAQFYFKCKLDKEFIDPGYFVTSLAYHCRLDVNWKRLNDVREVFKREDFFRPESLVGLKVQSKTYDPFSSRLYSSLMRIIPLNKSSSAQKQQAFHTLTSQLNLSLNPLPPFLSCLSSSSPYSILSLKQLLSQFIRPYTIKLPSSQYNFSHLMVFNDLNQFPQKKSLSIKMAEIKWYLRLKKKDKYLKKFEELINLLNKFYGDFSPALGEVYDAFANFHLSNGEYEDAITFAKSSLVNTLKICGTNHIKTAQAYYNLSLCNLKASKIDDAYNLLKKSKTIYESKQRVTTEAFASINLKLGLLMLTKNQINEAIQSLLKALQTFEEVQEMEEQEQSYQTVRKDNINWKLMFENEKTECYETLARCYELGKNKEVLMKNLKALSKKIQQNFLKLIQQPTNFQKILRLILNPYLQSLTPQQAARYIDVISGLSSFNPTQLQPKSYNRAYILLKSRLKENFLVENIESYLENSSSICDYIMLNGVLDSWKPFEKQYERETINDFVSITEEFMYFLGQGYLTGVLREVVEGNNKN